MRTRDFILSRITDFQWRHRIGRCAFGRQAVGDPDFVHDLEVGLPITLRRIEKAERYMDALDAAPSQAAKPVKETADLSQGATDARG